MGLSEWLKAPPPVAAGTCFFFAALASARAASSALRSALQPLHHPVRVSPLVLPLPALPGEAMDPNPR